MKSARESSDSGLRRGLLLGSLFVIGLAASVAWKWREIAGSTGAPAATVAAEKIDGSRVGSTDRPDSSADRRARGTAADPANPAAAGADGPPADTMSGGVPDTMSQEEQEIAYQATTGPDVDARVMAIHELRSAYSAESIELLGQFLVADPEPRVRIAAADTLRILASHDADSTGRIRVLLQGAQYDQHRAVAEAVQLALAEVEGMF